MKELVIIAEMVKKEIKKIKNHQYQMKMNCMTFGLYSFIAPEFKNIMQSVKLKIGSPLLEVSAPTIGAALGKYSPIICLARTFK